MSLKGVAKETLKIASEGRFLNANGVEIDISNAQKFAVENTKLYTPEIVSELLRNSPKEVNFKSHIEVANEKTQKASYRLAVKEGCSDLLILNYASARNPGGGFINGAKAQEEDLARSSGLYPCLLKQPTYYEVNREKESLLYTDHLIYSPSVPWFRVKNHQLLDDYYKASVITAPAPNAGQILRQETHSLNEVEKVLRYRAGCVLAVANENNHKNLLLGAWGCGVFCNDPTMVADAFGKWLESDRFKGCFERVVFGIFDSSKKQETLLAFQNRFS